MKDVIEGLKNRGDRANALANWMMAALVFTTAAGLLYYIIVPVWLQFKDAERSAYLTQAKIYSSQLQAMDLNRDNAWNALVEKINFTAHEIETGLGYSLDFIIKHPAKPELLAAGYSSGEIIRSADGGETWKVVFEEDLVESSAHRGIATSDDGSLVISVRKDGTVYRSKDFGLSFEKSEHTHELFPNKVLILKDGKTVIISGSLDKHGRQAGMIRSIDSGISWEKVDINLEYDPSLIFELPGGGEVIAPNHVGKVLKSTDGGASWKVYNIENNVYFRAHLVLDDGNTILIAGSEGAIYRSSDRGESWQSLDTGPRFDIYDITITGDGSSIIAVGGDRPDFNTRVTSAIFVSKDRGKSWKSWTLPDVRTTLLNVFAYPDSATVIAMGGDTYHVMGTSPSAGALIVSNDAGESWSGRYTPGSLADIVKNVTQTPPVALARSSSVVVIDNRYQNLLRDVASASGSEGDARMMQAIQELPLGIRRFQSNAQLIDDFEDSFKQRKTTEALMEAALRDANSIRSHGISTSEKLREYKTFMDVCGGGSECAASYVEYLAANVPDIWSKLVEKTPQALLLLFLLATFGLLYRYNARLSSFYYARADALSLADSAIADRSEILSNLSSTLAADRIDFGKTGSPIAEVAEIKKQISQTLT